jgi:hypothetical protein
MMPLKLQQDVLVNAPRDSHNGIFSKRCASHYPYLLAKAPGNDAVLMPNPDVHCFADGSKD